MAQICNLCKNQISEKFVTVCCKQTLCFDCIIDLESGHCDFCSNRLFVKYRNNKYGILNNIECKHNKIKKFIGNLFFGNFHCEVKTNCCKKSLCLQYILASKIGNCPHCDIIPLSVSINGNHHILRNRGINENLRRYRFQKQQQINLDQQQLLIKNNTIRNSRTKNSYDGNLNMNLAICS